jgi:hypothetical protein
MSLITRATFKSITVSRCALRAIARKMYVHRPPLVVYSFLVPWCVVNELSESSSIVVGDARWQGGDGGECREDGMVQRLLLLVKPIRGYLSSYLVSEFPLTYHSELIDECSASGEKRSLSISPSF